MLKKKKIGNTRNSGNDSGIKWKKSQYNSCIVDLFLKILTQIKMVHWAPRIMSLRMMSILRARENK